MVAVLVVVDVVWAVERNPIAEEVNDVLCIAGLAVASFACIIAPMPMPTMPTIVKNRSKKVDKLVENAYGHPSFGFKIADFI